MALAMDVSLEHIPDVFMTSNGELKMSTCMMFTKCMSALAVKVRSGHSCWYLFV
jgi:hypothetical protein